MLLPSVTDFSETKESLANHSAGGASGRLAHASTCWNKCSRSATEDVWHLQRQQPQR